MRAFDVGADDTRLRVGREKIEEVHAASLQEGVKPPQILQEEEALLEQELEETHSPFRARKATVYPKTASFAWPKFSWREANVFVLSGAFVTCLAVLVVSLFAIFRWEGADQTVASVSLPAVSVPSHAKTAPVLRKTIFRKPAAHSGPTLSFALSGISAFDNKHYAVINGTVLQAGDLVDGAVVKDITDNEAILETRAGELRLKIPV